MPFLPQKHVQYIADLNLRATKDTYEYWLLEHLRMNGMYWGVTALILLDKFPQTLPTDEVVDFVLSCYNEAQGGFGAFPKHDAHLLLTLLAVQILAMSAKMEVLGPERQRSIVSFVQGLQLADGSFEGDRFGEVDTRFVYTAVSTLSILGELTLDVALRAADFILRCENFDGGFGMVPGAESHAAHVFTGIGALAITDNLHRLSNPTRTANWLSERQVLPSGGFNGRPEKIPDVCYSWWVLSSLAILGCEKWVSFDHLERFILECQDPDNGGFSDRPGNQTDVFHTCFGLAGLSLIDADRYGLQHIDPVYCMPSALTQTFVKWRQL